MQIVIDIPDEMYDWYDNGFPDENDAENLWQIIKNGTPLPKGHDKLIDAKAYYDDMKKHYFDNTTVMRCTEIGLGCAPTIIEADKVESEEEPYKEVEV